jgi:hypothetical protein
VDVDTAAGSLLLVARFVFSLELESASSIALHADAGERHINGIQPGHHHDWLIAYWDRALRAMCRG